ncbi:MAG: urease subunit gamma [Nitrosopumilaceae archaeon]
MIHINVIVKGEQDIPPITKQFQYDDHSEEIFFAGVETIKKRLANNLKINLNETLLFYCAYIVLELRSGKTVSTIQKNVHKILSPDKVMVGVPESIQRIVFEVNIDNKLKETVIFNEPIQISDYILVPRIDDD